MLRRKRRHCILEVKHQELKIVKKLLSDAEGGVFLREEHMEEAEELNIDNIKVNREIIEAMYNVICVKNLAI